MVPNLAISCVSGHGPVGFGRVLVSSFAPPVPMKFSVFHHDMDRILLPVLEGLLCSDKIENLAMSDR